MDVVLIHFTEERTLPASRKLLILINPFSGSGKSVRIFHEHVEPMLTEAELEFNAITTGNLFCWHTVNLFNEKLHTNYPLPHHSCMKQQINKTVNLFGHL